MDEPIISVVVPAYRVGKLLERTIASIEKQTINVPFEVIFVVRESEDETEVLAEKWVKKNPGRYRIFTFNKFLGLGYSRFKGLTLSKGKYLYFLDGDDEIVPTALETFYKVMEETGCDIANSSFYYVREGNKREKNLFLLKGTLDKEEALNAFFHDVSFRSFFWCKMYRRELFYKGPLAYLSKPDDMFEDAPTMVSLLSYAEKIVSIPDPLYLYHKDNPGSITAVKRTDRALRHLAVYALQRHFLEQVQPSLRPIFFKHIARMKFSLSYDLRFDKKDRCTPEYIKKFREEMKTVFSEKSPLINEGSSYKSMLERAIIPNLDNIE